VAKKGQPTRKHRSSAELATSFNMQVCHGSGWQSPRNYYRRRPGQAVVCAEFGSHSLPKLLAGDIVRILTICFPNVTAQEFHPAAVALDTLCFRWLGKSSAAGGERVSPDREPGA
jgi:hypothetical protein